MAIQTRVALLDNFNRPDTVKGLGDAETGQAWLNAIGGKITSNRFVASFVGTGSVYARVNVGEPVLTMSGTFSFTAPPVAAGFAMICGDPSKGDLTPAGALNFMAHFTWTNIGWAYSNWQNGIYTVNLDQGNFVTPLLTNGTEYSISITYKPKDGLLEISLPDGTVTNIADPDLSKVHGNYAIYQIKLDAADVRTHGFNVVSATVAAMKTDQR